MNINLKKGMIFSLVLAAGLFLFAHPSMAQMPGVPSVSTYITEVLANLVNQALQVASLILAFTGTLLNFAITLTLNIKAVVGSSTAVYDVWRIIRDISGMFIIFGLLYSAILLITGLNKPQFGNLIKNIVIAGILINFSFFATSIAIDASNIVSLQLYNAIAPANTLNPANLNPNGIKQFMKDGGISDIFMKSLSMPSLFQPNGQLTQQGQQANWASPLKVMLIGIIAVMIVLIAAASFFFAAIAFIIRFVILIFLLAFSPIWFAAHVIPELKKEVGEWTNHFKSQLIFMPAYLLLMYFALKLLTSSSSSSLFKTGFTNQVMTSGDWYTNILAIGVNAVLVIIMINLPLFVAIRLGGSAASWFDSKKFGAAGMWKSFGSFVGRNSVGRVAGIQDKKFANTIIGNSSFGRGIRSFTTQKLATSKFGGAKSWEDEMKTDKDIEKKNKEIQKRVALNQALRSGSSDKIKEALGKLNDKQVIELGKDLLTDDKIVYHLKGSHYEAVKKSDDISDDDKAAIKEKRYKALTDAVSAGDKNKIKHIIDNMEGKDLMNGEAQKVLTDPNVIENLRGAQLKVLNDENLDVKIKKQIGNQILNVLGAGNHKAYGYLDKNKSSWT